MRRPEKLSLEQDGTKTWGRIYNRSKEIRRPTHLEVAIKRAELIRPNATLLLQNLCSRRTAKLRLLRTPCQKRIEPCHKRKSHLVTWKLHMSHMSHEDQTCNMRNKNATRESHVSHIETWGLDGRPDRALLNGAAVSRSSQDHQDFWVGVTHILKKKEFVTFWSIVTPITPALTESFCHRLHAQFTLTKNDKQISEDKLWIYIVNWNWFMLRISVYRS